MWYCEARKIRCGLHRQNYNARTYVKLSFSTPNPAGFNFDYFHRHISVAFESMEFIHVVGKAPRELSRFFFLPCRRETFWHWKMWKTALLLAHVWRSQVPCWIEFIINCSRQDRSPQFYQFYTHYERKASLSIAPQRPRAQINDSIPYACLFAPKGLIESRNLCSDAVAALLRSTAAKTARVIHWRTNWLRNCRRILGAVYAFWQSQAALTLAIINLFQLIKNVFALGFIRWL